MTHLTLSPSRYAALQAKAKGSTATRADEREGEGGRKRSKYRNVKTTIDGVTFDSAKEARRYQELRMLEKARKIADLLLQAPVECVINGILVCRYIADFSYCECASDGWRGPLIYEDCKSEITRKNPVYRLKKKLVKALHNIEIRET